MLPHRATPAAPSRRSALISLSAVDDAAMRDAKTGDWWVDHPHRAMANNSAVYDAPPSAGTFLVRRPACCRERQHGLSLRDKHACT